MLLRLLLGFGLQGSVPLLARPSALPTRLATEAPAVLPALRSVALAGAFRAHRAFRAFRAYGASVSL